MTAPPPAPPPHGPVPTGGPPTQSQRGRGGPVAIAVVVSLLVGIAVGYALFGGDGGGTDNDLDRACDLYEEVADIDFFSDDGPSLQDPEFWQLQSLSGLLTAHGYQVDDEKITELGQQLVQAFQTFDEDLLEDALDDVEDLC